MMSKNLKNGIYVLFIAFSTSVVVHAMTPDSARIESERQSARILLKYMVSLVGAETDVPVAEPRSIQAQQVTPRMLDSVDSGLSGALPWIQGAAAVAHCSGATSTIGATLTSLGLSTAAAAPAAASLPLAAISGPAAAATATAGSLAPVFSFAALPVTIAATPTTLAVAALPVASLVALRLMRRGIPVLGKTVRIAARASYRAGKAVLRPQRTMRTITTALRLRQRNPFGRMTLEQAAHKLSLWWRTSDHMERDARSNLILRCVRMATAAERLAVSGDISQGELRLRILKRAFKLLVQKFFQQTTLLSGLPANAVFERWNTELPGLLEDRG